VLNFSEDSGIYTQRLLGACQMLPIKFEHLFAIYSFLNPSDIDQIRRRDLFIAPAKNEAPF